MLILFLLISFLLILTIGFLGSRTDLARIIRARQAFCMFHRVPHTVYLVYCGNLTSLGILKSVL